MPETLPLDTTTASRPVRAPYTPPALDELGAWSSLTLQQSIPISPDVTAREILLIQSW
ncbi:MAG TPA: hypothetical protein VGB66_19665 [Longimicrobium sp.]